jgi:TetR/AcrR family transcriptional regulator, transcriptional repressor for nem operon
MPMDKITSKHKLLQAGSALMKEQGFNNTGLQQILQEVGVPKGSFYHFFSSKEEFGLEILRHYVQDHDSTLGGAFFDASLSPLARFRRYFEMSCSYFENLQFRQGCLVGNLSQELADQNETFRVVLVNQLEKWQRVWLDCLSQAQEAGEIAGHWEVETLAHFCLNSWEGALLRMKVSKSVMPLRNFITIVFDHTLKPE